MAAESKTVLIAGCGDLGTEAGLVFTAFGHRVIGVRRQSDLLPASFERQSVDLREGRPGIPGDLSAVVVALTAGARTAEAYRATYVDGLRNVLEAISDSGQPPRVILVSSTAVYGQDDGGLVDEQSSATAPSPTSAVLLEAEQLLASWGGPSCILRLGGIYGPGRERLIEQVRAGGARIPATPVFTNRIHRDDAARAIVHLSLLDEIPRTVIGVDQEPAELRDVLRFLAGELRLPDPEASDVTPSEPPSRRLSSALLRSTGFAHTYPTYREGYRAVLSGAGIRHP